MVEKIWDHRETVDTASTSQEAKIWNETSKDSKLNEILHKLDDESKTKTTNNKSKLVQKWHTMILVWKYKEFQKEIWMTNCNGKLWSETFDTLKNYLESLDQTESSQQDTQEWLKDLKQSITLPETLDNHVDNLKISRAARKYLSKHESLSESIFNLIFSWKEEIRQWQLWNCYFISWLIELTNTQYFDTLMRTSISRVTFKDDWTPWFSIKIPLWEPNGRDILIKDSEILMARVKWNIGYKLLELAYVKNRRPNNKEWNTYYPVTNSEIEWIRWWITREVLKTFLWSHNIWFSDFWSNLTDYKWETISNLPDSRKNEIANYLKNFNGTVWNNFTDLGTPMAPGWDSVSFNVWWNTLYHWHAYALHSVEKRQNWDIYVIVRNPRNNTETDWGSNIKLSLNEFFHAFSYIWVWKIKVDTFLDDQWVSRA
jgi:hypothetical protein